MAMKGFTLVEVLIVMLITVILTTVLVTNFSRSRISVNQAALVMQDAIREAQSLTLSGALWKNAYRCGYGIHMTPDGYTIFAGPDAQSGCSGDDFVYGSDDVVVRSAPVPDPTLELVLTVEDIYFVPPNPYTYMDGAIADADKSVTIKKKGVTGCPIADCKQVSISPAGLVTLRTPAPGQNP